MEVTANLINKYIFKAQRPGHSCSSCGDDYDDRIVISANSLDELRDKVAIKLAHRGWTSVKSPFLYTSEFLEFETLSFETERNEKSFPPIECDNFVIAVYNSSVYTDEVKRLADIMRDKKTATAKEYSKATRERELKILEELKAKYEPQGDDHAIL